MLGRTVLGIDMGTANTRIAAGGRGIVASGSSVVAVDSASGKPVAYGDAANAMAGRTPAHLAAVRPLKAGAVSDLGLASSMLESFIGDAVRASARFGRFKPNVALCVPAEATSFERRAFEEAAAAAGASRVHIVDGLLAAAAGAGLPVWEAAGCAVASIGGGKTEAAVVSQGGIVVSASAEAAGDALDEDVRRYLKRRYRLNVGPHTAERLKREAGVCGGRDSVEILRAAGLDAATGEPRWLDVSAEEIRQSMRGTVSRIVDTVKRALGCCPPELSADLAAGAIVLTGGGALLGGMAELIAGETGLAVRSASNPLVSAAEGACGAAERLRLFHRCGGVSGTGRRHPK